MLTSPGVHRKTGRLHPSAERSAQRALRSRRPRVAPHSRPELEYLVNRTESYRDLFAALNIYRRGMVNFDYRVSAPGELGQRNLWPAGIEPRHHARGLWWAKAATQKFSRLMDHVSDLAVLYELNARLILGTELSLQFLENVVNYHRGQPY